MVFIFDLSGISYVVAAIAIVLLIVSEFLSLGKGSIKKGLNNAAIVVSAIFLSIATLRLALIIVT